MTDEEDRLHRLELDQITLKTAHQNIDDRTARLEDFTQEIREVLYGDRRKKIDGLVSIQDEHTEFLRKINAVFFQDQTGQKGYIHDVDVLMGRYREKNEILGLKWQFWGIILAALIPILGAFFNWDHIQAWLDKKDTDPIDEAIQQAKRVKGRKIFIRKVHRVEEEGEEPR